MLLERTLNTLTLAVWGFLALYYVLYLINAIRRGQFRLAFRRLFTLRLPLFILFLVIVFSLIGQSLVFVDPQEVGVVVSLIQSDGIRDRPFRSGMRTIAPLLEQVERYPIYWQTYTMASKPSEGSKIGDDSIAARTADGQEVLIDCSIIFQIDPDQVIRVHIDWQRRYIEDFVRPVARGIIRSQVSQYTVDEVNSSKRKDLEKELDTQVRAAYQERGFILDRFVLRNIAFSPEYAAAVEAKQVALQDRTKKEHEAEQIRKLAQGNADQITILAKADAEAIRVRASAEADALREIAKALANNNELLLYRYIEKLSPAIRVMLVPNNAPLLLTFPTLDDAAPKPVSAATPTPTPTRTPTPTPTTTP